MEKNTAVSDSRSSSPIGRAGHGTLILACYWLRHLYRVMGDGKGWMCHVVLLDDTWNTRRGTDRYTDFCWSVTKLMFCPTNNFQNNVSRFWVSEAEASVKKERGL